MKPGQLVLAIVLLQAAWGSSAQGATYLIEPDGSGAFPTIQAALDAALPGDVIELANGVFRGTGNRDLDFRGKAVTVRSHSGNPDLAIIDAEGTYPSVVRRGFIFKTGEGAGSMVRDITIRDCATDDC